MIETPEPPPDYLKAEAKARWYEIQGILQRRGDWSNDFVPSLEQLCELFQHLAEIDHVIQTEEANGGFSLMVRVGRGIKINPLISYRLDVVKHIRVCLKDFGLMPSTVPASSEDSRPAEPNSTITTKPRILEIDEVA